MQAQPGGDFACVAQGMTQASQTPLAAGINPTVTGKPGGCVQFSEQAGISLTVGQHINMVTSFAKGGGDIADVEGPVAASGLECFFRNDDVQDFKAMALIQDVIL